MNRSEAYARWEREREEREETSAREASASTVPATVGVVREARQENPMKTTTKKRLKTMICTYLEPEQVEHLDRLARVEGRSKAEIIREALDRYIARAR